MEIFKTIFMSIASILEKIKVIQKKEFINPLGRKCYKRKFNPYNPISYLVIIIFHIIGIILFGIIGYWEKVDFRDFTFKYR